MIPDVNQMNSLKITEAQEGRTSSRPHVDLYDAFAEKPSDKN